jgi:hypothetical protein
MKELVRFHNKMIDGCLNIYNSLLGYDKLFDDIDNPGGKVEEKPRITVK